MKFDTQPIPANNTEQNGIQGCAQGQIVQKESKQKDQGTGKEQGNSVFLLFEIHSQKLHCIFSFIR